MSHTATTPVDHLCMGVGADALTGSGPSSRAAATINERSLAFNECVTE